MNSKPACSQKDMFRPETEAGPLELVLYIKGIQAPRTLAQKSGKEPAQNFHIPSFKNSKRWVTKTPRGQPLDRPLLITSPEFQDWMMKAIRSLELQLLSMCQTGSDATPRVHLRLSAICSSIPEDDSVNDWREGSWRVERVAPGEEGAKIVITRLS